MKNIIKKYYKIITIIAVLIILISIYLLLFANNNTEIKLSKKDRSTGITIYVKGEVKNPGTIYFKNSPNILQVIDKSGGITQEADISKLSLDKKLSDGDVVNVPIKKRLEEIIDEEENEISGKININTATKEKLMELEGIGETTAERIVKYRKNNRFKSIEDLMNVSGIGEKKFEKIELEICI